MKVVLLQPESGKVKLLRDLECDMEVDALCKHVGHDHAVQGRTPHRHCHRRGLWHGICPILGDAVALGTI